MAKYPSQDSKEYAEKAAELAAILAQFLAGERQIDFTKLKKGD